MAKGNVEVWLGDLLNQAMNSLHSVIRDAYHAINDGGFNLMNFLGQFASQVLSLVFWYFVFDYSFVKLLFIGFISSYFNLYPTHLPVAKCTVY